MLVLLRFVETANLYLCVPFGEKRRRGENSTRIGRCEGYGLVGVLTIGCV